MLQWLYAGSAQSSFAAPKRIRLRSNIQLSGALLIIFDYVIRCLNALSAGLKAGWKGLTFAETPLSAISRFSWSPESPEVRPLLKVPPEDGSSFRLGLEQINPSNERPFMKFVSLGKKRTHRRGKFDKPSRATLESFPS
jgi:hypothetical protein